MFSKRMLSKLIKVPFNYLHYNTSKFPFPITQSHFCLSNNKEGQTKNDHSNFSKIKKQEIIIDYPFQEQRSRESGTFTNNFRASLDNETTTIILCALHDGIGDSLIKKQEYELALENYNRAINIAVSYPAVSEVFLLSMYLKALHIYYVQSRTEKVIEYTNKVLELHDKVKPDSLDVKSQILIMTVFTLMAENQTREAKPYIEQALNIFEKAQKSNDQVYDMIRCYYYLIKYYEDIKDRFRTLYYLNKVIQITKQCEVTSEIRELLEGLIGYCYLVTQELGKRPALPFLVKVCEIINAHFPYKDNPDYLDFFESLVSVLVETLQFESCLETLEEIQGYLGKAKKNNETNLFLFAFKAQSLIAVGRFQEGLKLLLKTIDTIDTMVLNKEAPMQVLQEDKFRSSVKLSQVFLFQGKFEDALTVCGKVFKLQRLENLDNDFNTAILLFLESMGLFGLRREKEASESLKKAIEGWKRQEPEQKNLLISGIYLLITHIPEETKINKELEKIFIEALNIVRQSNDCSEFLQAILLLQTLIQLKLGCFYRCAQGLEEYIDHQTKFLECSFNTPDKEPLNQLDRVTQAFCNLIKHKRDLWIHLLDRNQENELNSSKLEVASLLLTSGFFLSPL